MRIRYLLIVAVFLLVACSSSPPPSTNQEITEKVKIVHGPGHITTVLLPVTIHGQGPFFFTLDTGASTSLIIPALAKRFGLQSVGSSQTITGIGGVQKAIPVAISQWQTGPIRLPTATIVSADIPHERGSGLSGLIGSDIWSRFGKFTLDYNSSTLTVYRQIALTSDSLV